MKPTSIISLLAILALASCSQETTLEESAEKLGITLPKASAMSVPDVTANWLVGCDEAFKEQISVVSPSTEVYIERDGEKVPLSSLNTNINIPWLTIYSSDKNPVYHHVGYSSNALDIWNEVKSGVSYPGPWPSLETVSRYSDLDLTNVPDADMIFVKYSADWCAPCKAQSADLYAFKNQNPNLSIAHVEIIADTRNLGGKCPI